MYKKIGFFLAVALTVNSASFVLANEVNSDEKIVMLDDVSDEVTSGSVIDYPIDGGSIQVDLSTGTVLSGNGTIENIVLPATVDGTALENIEERAFSLQGGLTALKSVYIPEGYKNIGIMAFSTNMALKEVSLPETLETIGKATFAFCSSLEKIKIPNKVTTIPQLMFFGCTKLNEVVLSENTVTIDQDAFQNCKSLTEITIPDSIEVIDNTAFEGCENLVTVYCKKGSVADNQELYPAEVTFVYTDDTPQILYGDADNNGLLTANDAAFVLQKVLGADFELPIQTATDNYMNYIDVDGNKMLTANDAASILQKVLDLNYKFPVEKDV